MFYSVAIATIILAALYATLILNFKRGWHKLKSHPSSFNAGTTLRFSIILPARNEAQNIRDCLSGILSQQYPAANYEIIVVDDFSEDETATIVRDFIKQNQTHNISMIRMAEEPVSAQNSFKKAAIKTAIARARFEWIVTSDADCKRNEKWLGTSPIL